MDTTFNIIDTEVTSWDYQNLSYSMRKLNYSLVKKLYLEDKKSTYQIARFLHMKPDTIKHALGKMGALRKAPGRDIEEKVAKWLEKEGHIIERQKGDARYDLLVDGVKVNVKSANPVLTIDKRQHRKATYKQWNFVINHSGPDFEPEKKTDYFYLVFLGKEKTPIYKLKASEVRVSRSLSICGSLNTKYPIQWVGYLD